MVRCLFYFHFHTFDLRSIFRLDVYNLGLCDDDKWDAYPTCLVERWQMARRSRGS